MCFMGPPGPHKGAGPTAGTSQVQRLHRAPACPAASLLSVFVVHQLSPWLPSCEALVWLDLSAPYRAYTLEVPFLKAPSFAQGRASSLPPPSVPSLAPIGLRIQLLFLVAAVASEHIPGPFWEENAPGPCSRPGLASKFCQSWVLEKMCSHWSLPLTGEGQGRQPSNGAQSWAGVRARYVQPAHILLVMF